MSARCAATLLACAATWGTFPCLGCSPAAQGMAPPTPGSPEAPEPSTDSYNPLYRPPDSYDFDDNPRLLARILSQPHDYFRFINVAFAREVCRRFRHELPRIPTVNLHGDAHLEQYAVTDRSRGLADFDDSSMGPFVIDLVRFGVSLRLAAESRGWSREALPMFRGFLRAYRTGLTSPKYEAPEPDFVRRTKAAFGTDRLAALARAESLMEPIEDISPEEIRTRANEYAQKVYAGHPELTKHFFDIKKVGMLRMGIGSALDEKYLFRVEGPTAAEDDDVILEAKEVRNLEGIDCIERPRKRDAMRILRGLARLAYEPYEFTGQVTLRPDGGPPETTTFWVHAWSDNYVELDLRRSDFTQRDLRQIATDVGVQLGRGHPKDIEASHVVGLRETCRKEVDAIDSKLEKTVTELAKSTVRAWKRFRREATADPPP